MPLPTIEEPWQRVAIDIVGPLQRTDRGHRYILTIMDFGTRYPEAVPLKRIDAPTVCEELMTVFTRFGFPQEILSDRGSNFTSKVTKALLEQIKVSHLKTSPYHPQSNGMLERFHATLKSMLRKTCPQPKEWDKWLPYLLFAYQESPHSATGFSPFELLFGREVRGPLMIVKEQWKMKGQPPQLVIDYITEVQQRLLDTSKLAREVEKKSKVRSDGMTRRPGRTPLTLERKSWCFYRRTRQGCQLNGMVLTLCRRNRRPCPTRLPLPTGAGRRDSFIVTY